MRSVQKVNAVVRSVFAVYDSSDNPVTGLVDANFTKLLSKDGASSAVAISISEIGSGRYTATFTPDASGVWCLLIRHATHNKRGWIENFDVNNTGSDVMESTNGIESGWTFKQIMRLMASILLGKTSNGPSGTIFRDVNDAVDRVTTLADSNGDRSNITLNP